MNDLFFTLLLYNKVKERRYKFYDCLVAHGGAYIDVNQFVEPTDTVTVAFKIYGDDIENRINRPDYNNPQQWIICARHDSSDPNTMMISPIWHWNSSYGWEMDVNDVIIIDNGNGTLNREALTAPYFDKKLIVTLYPDGSKKIVTVNKEKEEDKPSPSSVARTLDNNGRALLKLFAGYEPEHGGLCYNTAVTRIYSFYIQNANLQYTLRLQPAERLDTGEFGMYDAINDTFYPNKSSIGYFTAENNITDSIILDVESQIDTRKWQILFTSNNMPFRLSNGQLCAVPVNYSAPPLFANPNGTPATDGDFIDAWIRMGLPTDEVGLFNNTVLNRNQNSDVTYINNGDGSVTAKVGDDESPDGDYTRYAYQLNDIALSMVLIGNFEDIAYSDNSGFIIVTRPVGSNLNGGFRWRDVKSGRKAKNFLKNGESVSAQDIFFDTETSAIWAATGSTNQAEGDTLIGVMDNRPMGLRIYGMALYRGIHTTAELLQVAEWLDSLTKRPTQTREITSES